MNHNVPANKPVRRKGVTIAAAALSVALVAPFAQSVAYPEITAAAEAQQNNGPVRVGKQLLQQPPVFMPIASVTVMKVQLLRIAKLPVLVRCGLREFCRCRTMTNIKIFQLFSLKEQNLNRQDLTLSSPSGAGLVLHDKTKLTQKTLSVMKEPTWFPRLVVKHTHT